MNHVITEESKAFAESLRDEALRYTPEADIISAHARAKQAWEKELADRLANSSTPPFQTTQARAAVVALQRAYILLQTAERTRDLATSLIQAEHRRLVEVVRALEPNLPTEEWEADLFGFGVKIKEKPNFASQLRTLRSFVGRAGEDDWSALQVGRIPEDLVEICEEWNEQFLKDLGSFVLESGGQGASVVLEILDNPDAARGVLKKSFVPKPIEFLASLVSQANPA